MINKFYRTETINTQEWETIIREMEKDLDVLCSSKVEKAELQTYVVELLAQAQPLENRPEMTFFGFDDPRTMPSDCRVAYFFWPTYIATAFLMKACLLYPDFLGTVIPEEELVSCMVACTGRGFRGAGYDDLKGAVETMALFTKADVNLFLELHPTFCEEFTTQYDMWMSVFEKGIQSGVLQGAWGDSYLEEAKAILADAEASLVVENGDDGRYYVAYGSNLNIDQMARRCPDAEVVGTGMLENWRLWFKGSMTGNYLTIEKEWGYEAPVAVWKVSERDETNLDRYEGCPTFYYKKELPLIVKDQKTGKKKLMRVFAYIMHEERKVGAPRQDYVEGCAKGYNHFGFNRKFLNQAVVASGLFGNNH